MNDVFENFISALELKQQTENSFSGPCLDLGSPRVFGGHVLGQSLKAAGLTVVDERICNSYHGYFLRPGDGTKAITYEVERIRDGRSFSTRRVVAHQGAKPILSCIVSFHIPEASEQHQQPIPDVPSPEQLESNTIVFRNYPDSPLKTARLHVENIIPIELRFVDADKLLNPEKQEARQYIWFKAAGEFEGPLLQHQSIIAYASDFNLAGTCGLPHNLSGYSGNWQFSSLDHSIWFHHSSNINEWHLYVMDSPVLSSSRGLNRGSIYHNNRLVASVAQESLIRWIGGGERPKISS